MGAIRALILNSGVGKRMGELTRDRPKCMVEIAEGVTVLDLQLAKLLDAGIRDIVMTTGPFADRLEAHARIRYPQAKFTFVNNPEYATTNYIYSIALAEAALRGDDLMMLHGDLVFESRVLRGIIEQRESAVVVDSTQPLPEKDFKAVVRDGRVLRIGVEFFDEALACQPLYRLDSAVWHAWLDEIMAYCERGVRGVYAENAFNDIAQIVTIRPHDVLGALCTEVDTAEDLAKVREQAHALLER